jgi:hypothetical protein
VVKKSIGTSPAAVLRVRAAAYPNVVTGVACQGTSLESTTFNVGNKAFLFLRDGDLRLKLGESLPKAIELGKTNPSIRAGANGWVHVTLAGSEALLPVLEAWVKESYNLAAGKTPSAPKKRTPSAAKASRAKRS